jgi:hypothetical protein
MLYIRACWNIIFLGTRLSAHPFLYVPAVFFFSLLVAGSSHSHLESPPGFPSYGVPGRSYPRTRISLIPGLAKCSGMRDAQVYHEFNGALD